jgi:hypothetical protein
VRRSKPAPDLDSCQASLAGGIRYSEVGFSNASAQLNSSLLVISVIAILIPAGFHACVSLARQALRLTCFAALSAERWTMRRSAWVRVKAWQADGALTLALDILKMSRGTA